MIYPAIIKYPIVVKKLQFGHVEVNLFKEKRRTYYKYDDLLSSSQNKNNRLRSDIAVVVVANTLDEIQLVFGETITNSD